MTTTRICRELPFAVIALCLAAVGAAQAQGTPCRAAAGGDGPHLRFESDPLASFIEHGGFVVRYDVARRQPAFTVHALTPEAVTPEGRTPAVRRSGFRVAELPGGGHTATTTDYERTGYDRGHLVPAGDFAWDQSAKDETFTYANVAPFNPNLNRGAWAQLEAAVRDRVVLGGRAAYVVTGPLFVWDAGRTRPGGVEVPSHFYKLAYFPDEGTAYAFLFDNTIIEYAGDLGDFQTSVDFVERLTGEDFFDLLDDTCEGTLEAAKPPLRPAGTRGGGPSPGAPPPGDE